MNDEGLAELNGHSNVIIGRNPLEANANTGAIQLLGNPVANIRNCFALY